MCSSERAEAERIPTMQTEITWKEGVRFEGVTGSGHSVMIDGPIESGGQDAGARPMELVLMGVGSCSAYDVVTILKKSRQQITGCVAQLKAERAEEMPRVFTHITLHFVVTGHQLDPKKVERAVHLSAEKHCSASIMMQRAGVVLTHSFELVEATGSPAASEEVS